MTRNSHQAPRAPRLLFVVNQDWFFLSHRLPLARAARDAGADVTIVAGATGQESAIQGEGFAFEALPISRRGILPWQEWRTLRFLRRTYARLRPDIVHHVTLKPVLYGSLAARACDGLFVVNALSGLGYALTSRDARARALRPLLRVLLRVALSRPQTRTILQNPDDQADLERMGVVRREDCVLIRGSGVDCRSFRESPEPPGTPVVMLAARMLWDKGVQQFVDAARILRARGVASRFVLVGAPDFGNPKAIAVRQLEDWAQEGAVEWWGQRHGMPGVLSQATVVALPTIYGEGVPKVLLEAAASGRALVATDTRGCREIVRSGVNGLLVRPGDPAALAEAIGTLLASPDLRRQFGAAGRQIAVAEFAQDVVVAQTLNLYRTLLGSRWPSL